MTQERVTVNVSERHYSLLQIIVTENGSSRLDLDYATCFNTKSNTNLSWQYSEYQLLIVEWIFFNVCVLICFVFNYLSWVVKSFIKQKLFSNFKFRV